MTWHRQFKSFLMYGNSLPSLHSQYYGCWFPGNARSQGIISCDFDYDEPEQFGLRAFKV